MSYQTDNLFKLRIHEVGCIDKLVESGGSNVNKDHDILGDTYRDTYDYILAYGEQGREIHVRTVEVDDDTTYAYMVERQYSLLPKRGFRFVAPSFWEKGKPSIKLNWKPWVQERTVVVYVVSPYDNEELADVAETAADKLREAYFSRYRTAMKDAPLEDMVLTRLIRHCASSS